MAKQLISDQHAAFQALCRANDLDPWADVWQHAQSGLWIIARTGIEKIQYKHNITVTFDMVRCEPDFACVKATATRSYKPEGKTTATKLVVESFGSATRVNCSGGFTYFAEMAEKRALSRSVLKNMGFYALGVYGEDEAEDFRRPVQAQAIAEELRNDFIEAQFSVEGKGADSSVQAAAPKKPSAGAAAPDSAPLAASTTADVNSVVADPGVLGSLRMRFSNACSTKELLELWTGDAKPYQRELLSDKDAAKVRIDAAIAVAVKTPLVQKVPVITDSPNKPAADAQGQPIVYATGDQKAEVIRLLNHPVVPRPQKTNLLLRINKLTEQDAVDTITKLNELIDGPNGETERKQVAEAFRRWVRQQSIDKLIALKEVERLVNLAEKASTTEINAAWADARASIESAAVAA